MGNVIDPRIALGVQVPQVEGPIQQQQGAWNVQALINAVQLQKQQQASVALQQQQQQLQLQQQQQFQKDTDVFNKAFQDAKGDWDATIKNATTDGASGAFLLQKQIARADQIAKMATAQKDVMDIAQRKHDDLAKEALALLQISDPQDRATQYQQYVNKHLQDGDYKPTDFPANVPSEMDLQSLVHGNKLASDMKDAADKLRVETAGLPGKIAEGQVKQLGSISQMFSGANDQLSWSGRLALAKANAAQSDDPFMKAVIGGISENYTPQEAERVRQLGITPEKQASVPFEMQAYQQYRALPGNANKTMLDFQNAQAAGKLQAELPGKALLSGIEAQQRQAAMQGDPSVAGKMLANGDLTLADMKTRGMTPQFIMQATTAAQKINPNYRPADEVVAEKVASSQSANQFFGSANSLIGKGGTLDQLEQIGKTIPQHDLPVLNTIDDWQQLARGKGPLAGYASTVIGVADDYAKVMGGGVGSDASRNAVLNIFAKAASPEQRAAAIRSARNAVQSQRDSRIGNNQFLQRQYGAPVSQGVTTGAGGPPSGATHKVPGPDGKMHYTNAQGTVDYGVVP